MLPPPALNWCPMRGLKIQGKKNPSLGGFLGFYCQLIQDSDFEESAQWAVMVLCIYYYPKAVFWLSELMHAL